MLLSCIYVFCGYYPENGFTKEPKDEPNTVKKKDFVMLHIPCIYFKYLLCNQRNILYQVKCT